MQKKQSVAVVHGVVSGLLAGVIVALWFLVADVIAGDPLRTPTRLGAALFDLSVFNRSTIVPLYTLVHLGTFALIGAATAWFLAVTGTAPRILLGFVLGMCVLNAIHYVGLLLTSQRLLTVLPWPHVVGANVLAGIAAMTYLHQVDEGRRPFGLGTLRDHPLVAEGLVVGLVGAAAVAAWFFVIDIVTGAPLQTPAALGSAVFLGATGASEVTGSAAIIAAYSVLHLGAFGCVGILFAAVARGVERLPSLGFIVLLSAILLEAVTFVVLVAFGGWVLGALSLWSVGVGNLVAVGAMGWWLWRSHPDLKEFIVEEGLATTGT